MKLLLTGTAGAGGWPEPGCPCASCAGAAPARRPFGLVVDDVLRFPWAGVPRGYRVLADGLGLAGPDGRRVLYAPADRELPPTARSPYDVVLIDLLDHPERLGALRRSGAITARTHVVAVGLDHRVRSPRELHRRLLLWRATALPDGTLLTLPEEHPEQHQHTNKTPLNPEPGQDMPPDGTVLSAGARQDAPGSPHTGQHQHTFTPPDGTVLDAGSGREAPGSPHTGQHQHTFTLPDGTVLAPSSPHTEDVFVLSGGTVLGVGAGSRGAVAGRALILGGTRSGKSAEAELRLAAEPYVTYVATGPAGEGDAEWAARVGAHRARRPAHWDTEETTDLAGAIRTAAAPLLIDGLGTWLAAVFDEHDAWEGDRGRVDERCDELVSAWRRARGRIVAVSDEVGMGVVPATASGRAFRDALGRLNERLAAESEDVTLVVAGRPLPL